METGSSCQNHFNGLDGVEETEAAVLQGREMECQLKGEAKSGAFIFRFM